MAESYHALARLTSPRSIHEPQSTSPKRKRGMFCSLAYASGSWIDLAHFQLLWHDRPTRVCHCTNTWPGAEPRGGRGHASGEEACRWQVHAEKFRRDKQCPCGPG